MNFNFRRKVIFSLCFFWDFYINWNKGNFSSKSRYLDGKEKLDKTKGERDKKEKAKKRQKAKESEKQRLKRNERKKYQKRKRGSI